MVSTELRTSHLMCLLIELLSVNPWQFGFAREEEANHRASIILPSVFTEVHSAVL